MARRKKAGFFIIAGILMNINAERTVCEGDVRMNEKVIKELNEFLEGNFMAIHTYDRYIHRMDDPEVKKILQTIQREHKEHAALIAERIQNLGGKPVNDTGIRGTVAEFFANLKEATRGTDDILRDAIAGENRGIEVSRKMLEGDLDSESASLVRKILEDDEKHIDLLKRHLH